MKKTANATQNDVAPNLHPTTPTSMQPPTTNTPPPPETPEQIYSQVTSFLKAHSDQIFEVEILPSDYPFSPSSPSSVLSDGSSLGFTKKTLVQAFLIARRMLFSALKHLNSEEIYTQNVLSASAIILLFDPEHITAANYRKRHLVKLRTSTPIVKREDLAGAIQIELALLASLLTSPLHRHTKSPTLWHHRYWIAKEFFPYFKHGTSAEAQINTVYISELSLVMKAGERHPKNYYAWDYARRLFRLFEHQAQVTSQSDTMEKMARESVEVVHKWCLSHADDISGWSFLLFLLSHRQSNVEMNNEIVRKTMDLALKFHWTHESLWGFMRAVLASKIYIHTSLRTQFLESIHERLKTSIDGGTDRAHIPLDEATYLSTSQSRTVREVLKRTTTWIELNRQELNMLDCVVVVNTRMAGLE
ncbi:MAG: hypothetical protein M1836_004984 [Candelina mexicana]|nr:MAG: hypothetical protein M1836_004984 [Candelina mexicana]